MSSPFYIQSHTTLIVAMLCEGRAYDTELSTLSALRSSAILRRASKSRAEKHNSSALRMGRFEKAAWGGCAVGSAACGIAGLQPQPLLLTSFLIENDLASTAQLQLGVRLCVSVCVCVCVWARTHLKARVCVWHNVGPVCICCVRRGIWGCGCFLRLPTLLIILGGLHTSTAHFCMSVVEDILASRRACAML